MAIQIAKVTDRDLTDVLAFIEAQWRPGHVFQYDADLLNHQHRDPTGGYCFTVARCEAQKSVVGLCGYIPSRLYDPTLLAHNATWYTNWVASDGCRGTDALLLQEAIRGIEAGAYHGSVGLREFTRPLYRMRQYRLGTLPRIFTRIDYLASDSAHYELAPVEEHGELEALSRSEVEHAFVPKKTISYLVTKYLRHPRVRYFGIKVMDSGRLEGLLIVRRASNDPQAMLLVDLCVSSPTTEKLPSIVSDAARKLGFSIVVTYANFMIAHASNIADVDTLAQAIDERPLPEVIHYAVIGPHLDRLLLMKGDADQDRPAE